MCFAAAVESFVFQECALEADRADPPTTGEPLDDLEVQTGAGWGQRELILTAAALIGSGAITLGALSVREAAPPSNASAVPPARTAPSAKVIAAADTPSHWVKNNGAWTGSARTAVAFELAARNETQVWMKTVRPLLIVRCSKGRTEAFVFTDSPAAMEVQDEDHSVRISFDGDPGRTERWPDSSEHDALFAPDGVAFTAQLTRARSLRFGYTPHNSAPVVAHFDLAGLSDQLARGGRACGK
jgi:hypothetical protein